MEDMSYSGGCRVGIYNYVGFGCVRLYGPCATGELAVPWTMVAQQPVSAYSWIKNHYRARANRPLHVTLYFELSKTSS